MNENFLEQFVRDSECSVCANTTWFLANDGRPMSFLSFAGGQNPRIDVIGICCSKCGYMRFHASEVIGSEPTS